MTNYSNLSKEQLISRIKELEKQLKFNKYGLYWDRNLEEEKEICRILKNIPVLKKYESIVEDISTDQNHLLIEGDNFITLTLLNMINNGEGFVDVIYIDPPYNTGKEDFKYNDRFVGEDDGFKHSKWLNFMKKRLELAKRILKPEGTIFISIDDREFANLKLLCDLIFGEKNFVSLVPRLSSSQRSGQENYMNISHDYILIYSFAGDFNNITARNINKPVLKDHIGYYIEGDTKALVAAKSQGYSPGGDYDFEFNGKIFKPVDKYGNRNRWLWTYERMQKAKELGILVESGNTLRMQLYLDVKYEVGTNKLVPKNDLLRFHTADLMKDNKYTNTQGTQDLEKVIGPNDFNNPKPVELLKQLIKLHSRSKDEPLIVLDFFAGSGTLGQAVLELNNEGINSRFILATNNEVGKNQTINYLVEDQYISSPPKSKKSKKYSIWLQELESFLNSSEFEKIKEDPNYQKYGICKSITYPRLRTVITGTKSDGTKYSNVIPANLHYYSLDFIPDSGNRDQAKYNLAGRCYELICIAENTYNEVEVNDKYRIYENNTKTKRLFLYTDFFEEKSFSEFKNKIVNSNMKSVVYIFSTDNVIDEALFDGISNIEIKPMPHKMYEIYKDIVDYVKRGS